MMKTVKRLLFLVVMMLSMTLADAQTQTVEKYEVQSGETLYSISRKYGVTVDDIIKANPGMNPDFIMAGQTIKVPTVSSNPRIKQLSPCKETYTVKKKDTLWGIAQQYGLTEEEMIAANPQVDPKKLKKGSQLCIPYNKQEKQANIEKQADVLETIENERQESLIEHYETIKIAVIAPFALNETRRSTDAQKMTDFYKGFLMAVDTLKHQGISCDIYAYEEIGTEGAAISSVLDQPMLKHVNLIVGPFRPANAAKVAAFAAANHIKMVTPMSTKSHDLTGYSNLFEVSSPVSYTYQCVYNKFVRTFSSSNVVIVGMSNMKEHTEYITGLKAALSNAGIPFKAIDIADIKTLPEQLDPEKSNIIVPSAASERALTTICQKIRNLGKEVSDFKIQLFGYPEWQSYTAEKRQLEKYNASFYTTFFANPSSSSISRFDRAFTRWFHRDEVKSLPKYGVLGYDIGQYFIRGLHEKGSAFSAQTPVQYEGMQTKFSFHQRNDKGAALNNSVMFVRVNSDGTYSVSR